jgi:protein-S-isoprenylcysteine O-methyltransferase Ste14
MLIGRIPMPFEMPEFTVSSLWMILVPYMALAWIIMAVGDRLRGIKIEDEDHFVPGRMIASIIPWLALLALSIITPIERGALFWAGFGLTLISLVSYVCAISAFVTARRGVTKIGIYRASRNPMYVSLFVFLVGFVLMAWQAGGTTGIIAVGVSVWIGVTTHWTIITEERFLESKYGDEYLSYKNKVARYIGVKRGV